MSIIVNHHQPICAHRQAGRWCTVGRALAAAAKRRQNRPRRNGTAAETHEFGMHGCPAD